MPARAAVIRIDCAAAKATREGERIESLVSAIGKLAPRDELRAIIREEIQRAK